MEPKKIVFAGLVAGAASFLVGSLLYMNPLVSGLYASLGQSPCSKSMDVFGGVGGFLSLMFAGGLVSTVFLSVLYAYTEKSLGIASAWKRGLFFGFLFWLVAKVPSSYYTWMLYTYPTALNLIETFNGLVGALVAGIVLALMFERME